MDRGERSQSKENGESEILAEYGDLIREADAAVRVQEALLGKRLKCRPGCAACCTISSVLPLEGAAIRRAAAGLSREVRKRVEQRGRDAGATCPFLENSLCVIYGTRPLICRTHGLAIAYVDPEREVIEVSACHENFPPEEELARDELFFLDSFNARLARLNGRFCRAGTMSPETRIGMATLARGLSGTVG